VFDVLRVLDDEVQFHVELPSDELEQRQYGHYTWPSAPTERARTRTHARAHTHARARAHTHTTGIRRYQGTDTVAHHSLHQRYTSHSCIL
jgi:hypothetical protein